jgi:hypothetical protein
MSSNNMLGYGAHGAPQDVYATSNTMPTAEDPEYKAAVDEYVRQHPGVSRSEALNWVLRNRRDAKATKALIDSLASAIKEGGDDLVAFIGDQIHEFNKWVCDRDAGDDGIEIRKAA